MAAITFNKGQTLFTKSAPLTQLFLILKGSFSYDFPGGSCTLASGDVAGICELTYGQHFGTCTALETSSVIAYDITDFQTLSSIFQDKTEYCTIFARSAFKQMYQFLQQFNAAQSRCSSLYSECTQDYAFYLSCCTRHQMKPRNLDKISALLPYLDENVPDEWLKEYYTAFAKVISSPQALAIPQIPIITVGLLSNLCKDFEHMLPSLRDMLDYEKKTLTLCMNEDLEDLFDIYTAAFLKLGPDSPDAKTMYQTIQRMINRLKESPLTDQSAFADRVKDFENCIQAIPAAGDIADDSAKISLDQLAGSLQVILDFSEADADFCTDFKKMILQYRALSDRTAGDDVTSALTKSITQAFYKLYEKIFFKAVDTITFPLPVRMFLYFGYVDEQLAGTDNAVFLGQTAEFLDENHAPGVYTLYDWLLAIYNGQKDPSRNEFDQDYLEYLHSLKVTAKIDAVTEARLSKDSKERVSYELQNMFPTVNKMVFGRVTDFCPVFSSHNVLRSLDTARIVPQSLPELLAGIEAVDYSAFYREYVYSNMAINVPKEMFHVRILPDIILMPQIGIRGVMWQEIEGKKRTTPSRMMLPIFYLDDLRTAMIHLTGEYRWEMCKRVQGARWNDVSDRSLTSEYFDYVQFYRKNYELSADAKEKIKNALAKAHNSYKEMFVKDYITYILFEGTGSPRLNKTVRNIIFAHCPFATAIRESLKINPLYKETIESFTIKQKQMLHKLDLLEHRISNAGAAIPKELTSEREFLNS